MRSICASCYSKLLSLKKGKHFPWPCFQSDLYHYPSFHFQILHKELTFTTSAFLAPYAPHPPAKGTMSTGMGFVQLWPQSSTEQHFSIQSGLSLLTPEPLFASASQMTLDYSCVISSVLVRSQTQGDKHALHPLVLHNVLSTQYISNTC